mgnify:CR=1 FL=1
MGHRGFHCQAFDNAGHEADAGARRWRVKSPNPTGWEGLSTAIGGQVLLPDNGAFGSAKQVFHTNVHAELSDLGELPGPM